MLPAYQGLAKNPTIGPVARTRTLREDHQRMTKPVQATDNTRKGQPRRPWPTAWLINRPFALLFWGQAISFIGDNLFTTTIVLWIATVLAHNQPWAPEAVSGVLVAATLPSIFVGPLAGVWVDRWGTRRVMLVADAVRALLITSLLLLTFPLTGHSAASSTLWWPLVATYTVVFLLSSSAQFFAPARLRLMGDVVNEDDQPRAAALLQLASTGAMILGPALAAPLFFIVGVHVAMVLDALSFAVSWICILLIGAVHAARTTAGMSSRTGFWRELWEGARYVARIRSLRVLVVVGIIVLAGAGAFNALNVFFVTENLRAPASGYGYLQAVSGIGLVLGAAGATVFANGIGPARMFWIGVLAVGIAVLVYAQMTTLGGGIACILLIGLLNAPIDAAVGPLLLQATPRALLGRVSALLGTAMSLASITSVVLAGYLTSTVLAGVVVSIAGLRLNGVSIVFTASGVLAVGGGLYAMTGLRKRMNVASHAPLSSS